MEDKITNEMIWQLAQELIISIRDTIQKIDRVNQETNEKIDRVNQETNEKMDRLFKEMDERLEKSKKENEKFIRQVHGEFMGKWGLLVEALVEGSLVKILRERNIEVTGTAQRIIRFYQDRAYEIDILAVNGDVVVPVEVKTTLRNDDVKEFVETLKVFKKVFPEYKNCKVYGCMAYLKSDKNTTRYAYKEGLFVIKDVGDGAKLLNDAKFTPKEF